MARLGPRRSPTSPITLPPRRRSAAPSARSSYNLRAARAASCRARLRRGGEAPAHGDRARHGGPGASGPRSSSSSARPATGPARRRMRSRPSPRLRRSPASWAAPSCSPAPRSATRTPAGAPGSGSGDSVELLEEALSALGDESAELRVGLLTGPRPSAGLSRASESAARIVRGNAIELARSLGDRAGLARVLIRSYWSRGASPLEEILAMLTEAREIGRGAAATSRFAPRRWPGACRPSSRWATSTPPGPRSTHCW